MVDYSIDISDDIDKEFPIGQEFSKEFIWKEWGPSQQPVQQSEKTKDDYLYSNPKSVRMWRNIIQYFLEQYNIPTEELNDWAKIDLFDETMIYVINNISKVYNIDYNIVYGNLYVILEEEVANFIDKGSDWMPGYDKEKYINRVPTQPKRLPKYKYQNSGRGFGRGQTYVPHEDKIDEQKAIDWLIKYYSGTTFSINSIANILKDYVFKYMSFRNDQLVEFVKSLAEKNPEKFQLFDNKIHIGAPNTNMEFNNTEPQPEINHDDLKTIALSNIEDFKKYGEVTDTEDGIYIFIDRGASILAVAHLDTVQDNQHYYTLQHDEEELIHNAQLDDRLGAYIILDVLPKLGVKADILLTENEESGNSTAKHFVPLKPYKWIFEFDRAGTDAVMYQYEDEESKKLLEDSGIHVGKGSYSDIAHMEHLGVKAFNFGTGAYDSHNKESRAIVPQVKHCIQKFMTFYNKLKDTALPHESRDIYYKSRK
ncbi:MAG: hypothetical protein M0Q12_03245 [Synergistaceae bacterium]|jgi:hypothetical protein|nr:hypothetical protein [Synergistaceae bacterium]